MAIIIDFSGSMNNESDIWNCESYLGSYINQSNNPDTVVPAFGHYSNASAGLVSTLSSPGGSSNMTAPNAGMPAMEDSYYQTNSTQSSVVAFTAAPSSYGTQPMGDIPVYVNNAASGSFAQTPNNLFNTSYTTSVPNNSAAESFENGTPSVGSQGSSNNALAGYDKLYLARIPTAPSGRNNLGVNGFSGFTTGPKYYGKTFFQWPPDPRANKDWRQLYFTDASNNPVVNNTSLFTTTGWNLPVNGATNYHINYAKILNWIKNVGPNPFPSQLIAGQVLYYNSIPTDVPAAAYDHSQPNSNITDPTVRFWKEYIDYVVGSWRDPFGNVQTPGSPSMSYGPDFTWGTVQVSARPTGTPPNGSKLAYMNYADNPPRPRHRLWFGPMTMLQFIADTGLNPGTARDVSTFSTKLGIASVLQDIQLNHPNDQVSLILFDRPQYQNEPPNGQFTQAFYNLNRNYSAMINSLWYPPNSTSTTLVRPWDTNATQTPHSWGDYVGNTATQHALMLAYNQFSGSSTLSGLNAGGLGRVGAKRLVIVETDGMANTNTSAGFTNSGVNSFYNIQPGQTISAAGYDQTALLQVVQAMCNTSAGVAGTANSAVANPGLPGFATPSKPVVVHTIAFGIVFEIATATQTNCVGLLQAISQIGGTVFPAASNDPTNGYKWCIGGLANRVQLLQQAFSKVMDDGNSVSLIQ